MEKEASERYWSRFSDTYDKNQEYVVGKGLLDEITEKLNELRDLGEVVEFGCGTGYFTETIAQSRRFVPRQHCGRGGRDVSKQECRQECHERDEWTCSRSARGR